MPDDDKVVNAPVLGVAAPIAVLLIPVAVVLKLPDVKVKLFPPVLIDEAPSPESANAPLVAVRFSAPVVKVRPLDAVIKLAAVRVPVKFAVEVIVWPLISPEAMVPVPALIELLFVTKPLVHVPAISMPVVPVPVLFI